MTREEVKQRNEAVVDELFRLCNIMGNEEDLVKLINERIQREHRTIIQSFFGVLKQVIDAYAETQHYDLRNAQSVEWAKAVATKANDTFIKGRGFSFI